MAKGTRVAAGYQALIRKNITVQEFVEDNFDDLYDKHFDEMPYAVQKAREGDPYNWLIHYYDR